MTMKLLWACLLASSHAFSLISAPKIPRRGTSLQAKPPPGSIDARRRILLSRKNTHFFLDRPAARIEFGDTVQLSNTFPITTNRDDKSINAWLSDTEAFAQGLWRSDFLSKQPGDNIYRMGLLPVEFVMLQFKPWVEVSVKTVKDSKDKPVFTLQSIGYDPNPTDITFVPGMPKWLSIDDVIENLQIEIEVVGQIRARGENAVGGSMVYQVTGKLPAALLFFPDPVLKGAAETINREVVKFAVNAFQTGTTAKFKEFQKS